MCLIVIKQDKPSNPPDLIGSLPISTYISRPPVMDINLPI